MVFPSLLSDRLLITVGLLLVVVPGLYMYAASSVQPRLPTLRNKRICLLIAHPDDEAMFFAPTVLGLTRPHTGNHVKILCLSSGNADGLGETRKRELAKSAQLLGLRSADDVFVVDNPTDFPDGMGVAWDKAKIAGLLSSEFAPYLASSPSSRNGAAAQQHARAPSIDVLITFDAGGVSGHTNHISLYHGAREFIRTLKSASTVEKGGSPVDLYILPSVSILRKYTAVVDAAWTLATLASSSLASPATKDANSSPPPKALLFTNRLISGSGRTSDESNAATGIYGGTYATARRAMTKAHTSQMVWFRWGWILLSRYMYINDLRLEEA